MAPPDPTFRRKQKAAEEKQREGRQDAKHEQIIETLERAINHYKTAHKERESAKRYERIIRRTEARSECRRFWLEVATTIAAFAAAAIAICAVNYAHNDSTKQYGALGGQIQAMNNQLAEMQAEQRAWISVSVEPSGAITWENGTLSIRYIITVKNTGKTPAINVRHNEFIVLRNSADPVAEQASLARGFYVNGITQGLGNWTIMSGEDRGHIVTLQVNKERIELEKAPWIRGPTEALIRPVIVGVVYYNLATDKSVHQTGFIYEVGYWDKVKNMTVSVLKPDVAVDIPADNVRIYRHPDADGYVD